MNNYNVCEMAIRLNKSVFKAAKEGCEVEMRKKIRRKSRLGSLHSSTTSGHRRRLPLKINWNQKKQHKREILKRTSRN